MVNQDIQELFSWMFHSFQKPNVQANKQTIKQANKQTRYKFVNKNIVDSHFANNTQHRFQKGASN